jgi:predicted transcriptional regulator of viral defense system
MASKLDVFFAAHPVFTVQELDEFLSREGTGNTETRKALLIHHQRQGHIVGVRRGVYASVPVDPFLLATRLADDAVLGYHAALAFHGRAYSVRTEYVVISPQPHLVPLSYQGNSYRAVRPPAVLSRSGLTDFGVETAERAGLPLKVTTLERTLVDVLDRPELAGGWEEIWRSFEGVASLNIDLAVSYALLLENAMVAAKVGYFLEQFAEPLGASEEQIQRLRERRPRQPRYAGGERRDARFVPTWNLMIPSDLLSLTRREVA